MIIDEILNKDVLWQMSQAEKASILYLLNKLPKLSVAIEVGSYKGGFLQVLAKYFKTVYSCDIDHSNIVNKEQYENVVFVEGDSEETLPRLIEQLNQSEETVNFILIDGDHSYDAVLNDINNALQYLPKGDLILLIHDSWYDGTREAINHANWKDNPYVQYIEKDFAVGDMMYSYAEGNIFVGGLALAVFSTNKRRGDIEIKQTHDYMYCKVKELMDGVNNV